MSYRQVVLTAGFAMFSMFFGSGNLVFPLLAGQVTTSHFPAATLGFLITAVLVPFLGLIGMILYDGDTHKFFSKLGRIPSFLLILMILTLMGPLGVVPRCISVAYGGLHVLYPNLPYWGFSLGFCILITILIWNSNRVVEIIGLLLTPFKLGGLFFLMVLGLYFAEPALPTALSQSQSLGQGLTLGYQTMDLMAAFFFSSTTVHYLRNNLKAGDGTAKLVKLSVSASLIGAFILAVAYIGFVALGAMYAPELTGVLPESLLAVTSQKALGYMALPVVAFTMAISCLATAVILTLLFVNFLHEDVLQNKVSEKASMIITVIATFVVSLLGFSQICTLLGIVLEITYPALIVFTITNILNKTANTTFGPLPFWLTLAASVLYKLVC